MAKVIPDEYVAPGTLRALGHVSGWLKGGPILWSVIATGLLAAAHLVMYFFFIADDIFNGLNTQYCAPVLRHLGRHWVTRIDDYGESIRVRVPNFGPERNHGCVRWASHGILHNLWVMPWLSVTVLSVLGAVLGLALMSGPGRRALARRGKQRHDLALSRAESAAQTKHWMLIGDPEINGEGVKLVYADFHEAQQVDYPQEHTGEFSRDRVSWEAGTGPEATVRFPLSSRLDPGVEAVICSRRRPDGIKERPQHSSARHRAATAKISQL
jgi:hypothetical protein